MIRSDFFAVFLGFAVGLSATSCGGDSFEAATTPTTTDPSDASIDQAVVDSSQDSAPETRLLALGSACHVGADCESSVCADGVCCDTQCKGCMACNLPSRPGKCQPVEKSQDPHSACKSTVPSCSGACDGAGACAWPGKDASCGPSVCSAIDALTLSVCDGAGACVPSMQSCGAYQCDSAKATCFSSCTEETEKTACAASSFCKDGACVAKFDKGTVCSHNGQCSTGNCVDHVCCDSACAGLCESCSVEGKLGSCTAVAMGQDPDKECVGNSPGCGGFCDGTRQCEYQPKTTACADTTCGSDNAVHSFRCDGKGTCVEQKQACELFACDTNACKSTCDEDTSCATNAYCDLGATKCAAKKIDGIKCGTNPECLSGHCEASQGGAACCATTCKAPMDCASGTCRCGSVTCGPGVICFAYYEDLDQDGYGNPAKASAACENQVPTDANGNKYIKNSDDCDDTDARANPAQTQFFTTPRNAGGWDFNCNGKDDPFYRSVSSDTTCKNCGWISQDGCSKCNLGHAIKTYGFMCLGACGISVHTAFKEDVKCGAKSILFSCNNFSSQCGPDQSSTPGTVQSCR